MQSIAGNSDASHSSKVPLDPSKVSPDEVDDTAHGPDGKAGGKILPDDMAGMGEAGKLPAHAAEGLSNKERRAIKQQAYAENLQEERAIKVSRSNRVVLGE